jgi:SAM-dependent methyltransferase
MKPRGVATATSPKAFYQDFSFEVGLRDWLVPNPRHEQLKLLVSDVLQGSRGLRILDLGCGAGVMSDYLTAYGAVVARDFSLPAIRLGRLLAPRVEFQTGDLNQVAASQSFDVVTMFDVLEHIDPSDRAALLERVRQELAPGGRIVLSTPHARYTRWLQTERPHLLQVIDEAVDLSDLLALTEKLQLALVRYETYEIDGAGPQYQLLVLGDPPVLGSRPTRPRRLTMRLRTRGNSLARVTRRARTAFRLVRRGQLVAACWFVVGKGRPPRSILGEGTPPSEASRP